MRKVIITIAVLMVSAGAARGGTITVGKDGQYDFNSIQAGIDDANDGDTVMVEAGVYVEEIDFSGKAITVSGAEGAPVLEAVDYFGDAVSFYNGEGENSILQNFVIRNSYAGVFVRRGQPVLKNLTIVNCINGIEASSGAGADISNCILRDNFERDLMNCAARYSCIESGGPGGGNIVEEPLFADANSGDYHLKSQGGRWDVNSETWVVDRGTSPCIDAGDWATPVGFEPFPNGGRINMGAFGGISEASKSYFGRPVCETIIAGDINGDCIVDFKDFAILARHWLEDKRPVNSNFIVKDGIEYYMQTNKFVYHLGENVEMLYRVTNLRDEDVTFGFTAGPVDDRGDFLVEKDGERIWDNLGRPGTTVLTQFTLSPLESRDFTHLWDMTDSGGRQVTLGNYDVTGALGSLRLAYMDRYIPVSVPIQIIPE